MSTYGFHNFQLSFCEGNPKWSFCLLLWNHLLIVKFLPVTFFRELVPAFWEPPVPLKVVPKPASDYENGSKRRLWMYTRKNWPMRAQESLIRNLMRLLELFFSKKQAKTSYWFFSRTKEAKNLKTICACQESTDLIL